MFRIPSIGEIAGLFHQPNSVEGATGVLHATAQRLDGVLEHHNAQATRKGLLAGEFRAAAVTLESQVGDHQREAGRAAGVASKLEALLS